MSAAGGHALLGRRTRARRLAADARGRPRTCRHLVSTNAMGGWRERSWTGSSWLDAHPNPVLGPVRAAGRTPRRTPRDQQRTQSGAPRVCDVAGLRPRPAATRSARETRAAPAARSWRDRRQGRSIGLAIAAPLAKQNMCRIPTHSRPIGQLLTVVCAPLACEKTDSYVGPRRHDACHVEQLE